MAELVPAKFEDLVTRLHEEPAAKDALFGLQRRFWYAPEADGPDHGARFHGRVAGNPLGPAAGPHTQMAQNLLLSYAAGARILELKTVQVNDRLTIPRPCIDMTNVGYNVEWSQELRVEESLREYVAGAMLIQMFRHGRWLPDGTLLGPCGEVLYDISVGYDLAGIRSEKVRGFLDGMRDASALVGRLRAEIPAQYADLRSLDYPTRLSDSVTLSTFHGCPAEEIERICEYLIGECDFDVIVKMNPQMLGQERLEHLLYDVLGYRELTVNSGIYERALSFGEGVEMCRRLTAFATARGRSFGCKFTNTLEVLNHRDFFTADNKVMYLSGQPLHVIALTLADEFRQAVGPHVAISFSAGVDRGNCSTVVACGIAPVTVSTDLLRPGGYGRLPLYLRQLSAEMKQIGASSLDQFILGRFDKEEEARRLAAEETARGDAVAGLSETERAARWAGWLNTPIAAAAAREDARYQANANRKSPKRIDSHLETFDCITCDKCVPVCPNAANFTYSTPVVAFEYHDVIVAPDGGMFEGEPRRFAIEETTQIACYADFCNECGNCDTFCPEYGGPYIKKPSFYSSVVSWRGAAPRDGFVVRETDRGDWICGRIKGREYRLEFDRGRHEFRFDDGVVEAVISAVDHRVRRVDPRRPLKAEHRIEMGVYHAMRHLRAALAEMFLSDRTKRSVD